MSTNRENTNPYTRNLPLALKSPAMTDTVCDRLQVEARLPDSVNGTREHYTKTLAALNRLFRMGVVTKQRQWTGKRWGFLWSLKSRTS
jgi:hypothetical protein